MFRNYLRKLIVNTYKVDTPEYSDEIGNLRNSIDNINANVADLVIDSARNTHEKYGNGKCISASYGQVYSQNNEDGIISEVFRRIGTETKKFVEIGAGDGIENTTRLLLETGWSGIWLEAGKRELDSIRNVANEYLRDGSICLIDKMINVKNVDELVLSAVDFVPDYVSIDIDYNTSHIWKKLISLRPRLFCIEYNAHYPPSMSYEVPYKDDGVWAGTTRFGASLKALENIGRDHGYSLVGCDIFGVNAFFVRDDLCDEDLFLGPFTAENHYEPPRFGSVRMRGHARHLEI